MSVFGCNCKCRCILVAVLVSLLVGILTTILQITGTLTATPAFLWVVFGIAVVYLGGLAAVAALRRPATDTCVCPTVFGLLVGILGTILFALVLLGVGVIATSVLSAILVGVLLFFFALMLTATACLVRAFTDCARRA